MEKEIKYEIERTLYYSEDYVEYRHVVDTFFSLKKARKYLVELLKLLGKRDTCNKVFLSVGEWRKINRLASSYGLNNDYYTIGVKNEIIRKITYTNTTKLKGV